ncbi:MAG: hypothetical protein ACYTHK_17010 [Planctomycetota bacterium]|jgi:hypothetical protein
MEPALENPYGSFRAPRVPLDLRCIGMGAAGWGVLQLADGWMARIFETERPISQLMGLLGGQLGRVAFLGDAFELTSGGLWGLAPYTMTWWQGAVAALIFFAVWAVFGGALLRIAALRFTRNEALRPKDALRFGFANAGTLLLVPILVALFALILGALNALAGLIMSLWFIGSSILALVLFPLALLSSVLLVMALIGGVLGLPLMWSGATVEQNGALESVSRTFSYVSARPFHFFFAYLLIFVVMSAVTVLEGFFEQTTKSTIQAGIVRTELDEAISKPPPKVDTLEEPLRDDEAIRRRVRGIADLGNIGEVAWYDKPGFFWMWLLLSIFLLGFKGYAIYIFLGGSMSLYLLLRREVDGTHEDELAQLEDEEGARGGEGTGEARWVGGKPTPDES